MTNFSWDDAKNRANYIKHGLTFEEAVHIFAGRVLDRIDDRHSYGETRVVSIGLLREVVAVTVVHTDRDGGTRIISARLANRRERKLYDDHFGQAAQGTSGSN